jgi:hypothetical protein
MPGGRDPKRCPQLAGRRHRTGSTSAAGFRGEDLLHAFGQVRTGRRWGEEGEISFRAVIPQLHAHGSVRELAPPVSFLPGQAASSHQPVAYRVARLPVSPGQAA